MGHDLDRLLGLLMTAEDDDVVVATITGLGKIGAVAAVEDLIGRVASDSGKVRRAAIVALGSIGDARATRVLATIATSSSESDRMRRLAAHAALDTATRDQQDVILEIFRVNEWTLQAGEARQLTRFADRKVVPLLVGSIKARAFQADGIELDVMREVFDKIWGPE